VFAGHGGVAILEHDDMRAYVEGVYAHDSSDEQAGDEDELDERSLL
jgi:hypothetical protein